MPPQPPVERHRFREPRHVRSGPLREPPAPGNRRRSLFHAIYSANVPPTAPKVTPESAHLPTHGRDAFHSVRNLPMVGASLRARRFPVFSVPVFFISWLHYQKIGPPRNNA